MPKARLARVYGDRSGPMQGELEVIAVRVSPALSVPHRYRGIACRRVVRLNEPGTCEPEDLCQSEQIITDKSELVFHNCAQSCWVARMISSVLWVKSSHICIAVFLTCSALSNTGFSK